jgi:hypothetical protein
MAGLGPKHPKRSQKHLIFEQKCWHFGGAGAVVAKNAQNWWKPLCPLLSENDNPVRAGPPGPFKSMRQPHNCPQTSQFARFKQNHAKIHLFSSQRRQTTEGVALVCGKPGTSTNARFAANKRNDTGLRELARDLAWKWRGSAWKGWKVWNRGVCARNGVLKAKSGEKKNKKKKKKGGGVWGCFLPQPGNALSMTVRPALFPLDLY